MSIEKDSRLILVAQRNEITAHHIYKKLSERSKDAHNRKVLEHISMDELRHYNIWKKYTNKNIKSNWLMIWVYVLISKVLGLTFGIKLMERGEDTDQKVYGELSKIIPKAKTVMDDEKRHEKKLIDLIEEEKLKYVGSMVLGLNDALVELTGTIAGLTFAFQNARMVGIAGLITGIAASFSMSASEYLSTKTEESKKNPVKASVYTGIAYIFTVMLLVIPFFILNNHYFALGFTIMNALIVIIAFTFYISVAKDMSFKKRFLEMAAISIGIAALSFLIGLLVRVFLHIDI